MCCNDIRRTFCTRLRMVGCDYELREYLMGHKIPGVSYRYSIYNVNTIAEHLKTLEEKIKYIWHTEDFEELLIEKSSNGFSDTDLAQLTFKE